MKRALPTLESVRSKERHELKRRRMRNASQGTWGKDKKHESPTEIVARIFRRKAEPKPKKPRKDEQPGWFKKVVKAVIG